MFLKRRRITENSSRTKHKIRLLVFLLVFFFGYFFIFFVFVFVFLVFCFVLPFTVVWTQSLSIHQSKTNKKKAIKLNNENLTWVRCQSLWKKSGRFLGWAAPPQQSQPLWGCQGFREFQVEFLPNFGENRKEYSDPTPPVRKKQKTKLCSQIYLKARRCGYRSLCLLVWICHLLTWK